MYMYIVLFKDDIKIDLTLTFHPFDGIYKLDGSWAIILCNFDKRQWHLQFLLMDALVSSKLFGSVRSNSM